MPKVGVVQELSKSKNGFAIPDETLRLAYQKISKSVGSYREKFVAYTRNLELVRQECGPAYAHVPIDDIRNRISTCCKNPGRHGNGPWAMKHGEENGNGKMGLPDRDRQSYDRIREPDWPALSEEVKERDGYRCRLCNSKTMLQCHHRDHSKDQTDKEHEELTTLCDSCHTVTTARIRYPRSMLAYARKLLSEGEEDNAESGPSPTAGNVPESS